MMRVRAGDEEHDFHLVDVLMIWISRVPDYAAVATSTLLDPRREMDPRPEYSQDTHKYPSCHPTIIDDKATFLFGILPDFVSIIATSAYECPEPWRLRPSRFSLPQ